MRASRTPLRPLLDGLTFAEAPRWHSDRLWFSDIFARKVLAVDIDGRAEVIAEFDDDLPCGLGFLPDGTPLVVSMKRPVVLALEADGPRVHADLTSLAVGALNDMVVDDKGNAYVGAMGTHAPWAPRPLDADGNIILVEPDGTARLVAEGMDAPNGPAITRDGSTYIVAEFPASRLIGFDRSTDGSLTNRRVWADLSPGSADGIAVDSVGAVWTASPRERECRRVLEGGQVTDVVPVQSGGMPLACALGGPDGRTLFVLSARGGEAAIRERRCTSVVETVTVDVGAW